MSVHVVYVMHMMHVGHDKFVGVGRESRKKRFGLGEDDEQIAG